MPVFEDRAIFGVEVQLVSEVELLVESFNIFEETHVSQSR